MALDVQIFPVAGKVAAIVFFLPASATFVAALSHGNKLTILATRRTLAPHGRDYFILVTDPAGSAVDGNGLLIVAKDKTSGIESHLDISPRPRWEWSTAIKSGLGAWLESHEREGGAGDLLGLRRFLSTVSAQTTIPVAAAETMSGYVVAIEGRYPGTETTVSCIVETRAGLLSRRCDIAVSASENLTLFLLPERGERAYVDLDGTLVEFEFAVGIPVLPRSPELAEEVANLIARQERTITFPDLNLPISFGGSTMAVDAIASDGNGLIAFLIGGGAADCTGWTLSMQGTDEHRLDEAQRFRISAQADAEPRFIAYLDGISSAGPVRVSTPDGTTRWLRILGHGDPLLHALVRHLGPTMSATASFTHSLDRLRKACGAAGVTMLRSDYGPASSDLDGDTFVIWDDFGDFDSVQFSFASLPAVAGRVVVVCAGASAAYRQRVSTLAQERTRHITLIDLPLITDAVVVLQNIMTGHTGNGTVLRAGASQRTYANDSIELQDTGWAVGESCAQINGVSFDICELAKISRDGREPVFNFDAVMEFLVSKIEGLTFTQDALAENRTTRTASMIDVAEVVRLDRGFAHAS